MKGVYAQMREMSELHFIWMVVIGGQRSATVVGGSSAKICDFYSRYFT